LARDVVKGYKYDEDRYVVVTDADLKRASPERTQRIDIAAFVDAREIPPLYFERPYYLEPVKSEKPYALLREAMRRAGKTAVATVVIKSKEYLAAVLPVGDALVLELLRFRHEL